MSSPAVVLNNPNEGWSADTTLDAAVQNSLASAKVYVAQYNARAKDQYLGFFHDWCQNVTAFGLPRLNPPAPPLALILEKSADYWGWTVGKDPVCEMPPLPPPMETLKSSLPLGVTDVGDEWPPTTGTVNFFRAGHNDTQPAGFTTTIEKQDGTFVKLVKVTTPWGGHYEPAR